MTPQQTTSVNSKTSIALPIVIQVIFWIIAAMATYGAVNARVAVVESKVDQFKDDVREMKMDIKELLRHAQ